MPDGVMGVFRSLNPSGRIIDVRSTQRVREMSSKNTSLEYRRPVRIAEVLTIFFFFLILCFRAS